MLSERTCGNYSQTDLPLENSLQLFDSTAELSKSVVRELFIVQSWMLDGACAAILHLTQSSKLNDYLHKRKKRISIKQAQPHDRNS